MELGVASYDELNQTATEKVPPARIHPEFRKFKAPKSFIQAPISASFTAQSGHPFSPEVRISEAPEYFDLSTKEDSEFPGLSTHG
jgi:hypothetical protein